MSIETGDKQQQKVREFMSLLPLTLGIAGLPESEPSRTYTESQMEARAIAVKSAYKIARQIIMDVVK